MKKLYRFGLVSAALFSGLSVFSAPLSPEAALQRVGPGVRSEAPRLVHTVSNPGKEAAVYVFNRPEGGFMVVSADDAAYALLGYSDTGSFDVTNVPPQLSGWLEGYASQIDAARALEGAGKLATRGADSTGPTALQGAAAIQPQLTTRWNQDAPYNWQCPEVMTGNDKFTKCWSGCVATAMAQVMNYFKYPEVGTGSIQYTPPTLGTILSLNFADQPFDWDNMLNTYTTGQYTAQQGNAVAYLMKACGYAVEMQYYITDSGAYSAKIPTALTNYFKYDDGVRYLSRLVYSDEEWYQIIYDNLAQLGPVIYDGTAPFVGGHSFVCDGYDGKGYFHFNWGWGGLSDGYFSLEALNPSSVGIGGFAGGFNVDQNAVVGIRKPDGTSHKTQLNVMQYGNITGSIQNGNSIRFGAEGRTTHIFNYSPENLTLKIGAIFENTDGSGTRVYSEGRMGGKQTFSINSNATYTYSTYDYPLVPIPEGLADGVYRAYLATMQVGFDNAQWLPIEVRYGNTNYVALIVENGKYSIGEVTPADVVVDAAWFNSDLIYGSTSIFHITLTNTGDVDLTRAYYPVFSLNDDIVLMGDTKMITIPANETITTQWEIGLTRLMPLQIDRAYTFQLWVADADAGVTIASFGLVKVKPFPQDVNFTLRNYLFEGTDMQTKQMNVNGQKVTVYTFPSLTDMTLRITAVPSAYFDGDLFITASGAGNTDLSTGVTEVFRKNYEIYKDVQLNTRIKVTYPDPEPGVVYSFKLYSDVNGTQKLLGEVFVALDGESGITEITDDAGAATYYSLTGVPVAYPKAGDVVIKVVPGKKPVKIIYKD